MSANAPQVECRLCATLYPDTLRFCPNCSEPSPQVHEDLLMAARLTGVSYEILLQRAWAEEGLVRLRRPPAPLAARSEATSAQRRPRPGRGFVERVRRHGNTLLIGSLALLGLATLAIIALLLVELLGDRGGDDTGAGVTAASTQQPAAPTTIDQPTAAPTAPVASSGSGSPPPAGATPSQLPLILAAGQTATYADGYSVRILSYDDRVASQVPDDEPAAGFRYVAVEVEACAGARPADAAPTNWRLEMPDGEQFGAVELPVGPALAETELPAGGCAAGWVAFEVPAAPDPAHVVHNHPDYQTTRFAWPG